MSNNIDNNIKKFRNKSEIRQMETLELLDSLRDMVINTNEDTTVVAFAVNDEGYRCICSKDISYLEVVGYLEAIKAVIFEKI